MENQEMKVLFKPTTGMLDVPTHYCPGCTHGIIHRLVGEVLEELDIIDKTIGVAPVGCSVLAYDYFACDMFEAAHGRAPAVATGIKRANPDKIVFTYQGRRRPCCDRYCRGSAYSRKRREDSHHIRTTTAYTE